MIHLVRPCSTFTVCGIDRQEAKGDVSVIRTEVDCPRCRRSRRTSADIGSQPGPWTPQALGITHH